MTPARTPRVRPLVAAMAFLIGAWFEYQQTLGLQLASMLALVLVVVVGLAGLWRIRTDRWRGAIATVACLLSLPAGRFVGNQVADADFYVRRRAQYEHVISKLRSGQVSLTDKVTEVTSSVGKGVDAPRIFALRPSPDSLRVEFLWGVGFPVKHTAYIYTSTGDSSLGAFGHWHYRQLDSNWFEGND